MGGFFGAVANRDVIMDVFFGVDYHSHLGTRRAGMAAWDPEEGFQRSIQISFMDCGNDRNASENII